MRTSARGRRSPPTATAPGRTAARTRVPRRRDHHRVDAHRTQQLPADPHAHEPREHRLGRAARGAVPAAQVLGAALAAAVAALVSLRIVLDPNPQGCKLACTALSTRGAAGRRHARVA
eukprot:scaffold36435_cov30-Phaeocystis_antarctica.AAC.1